MAVGRAWARGRPYPDRVDLGFAGEVWFWRGPSPYHFVTVPDEDCVALEAVAYSVVMVIRRRGREPRFQVEDLGEDLVQPQRRRRAPEEVVVGRKQSPGCPRVDGCVVTLL